MTNREPGAPWTKGLRGSRVGTGIQAGKHGNPGWEAQWSVHSLPQNPAFLVSSNCVTNAGPLKANLTQPTITWEESQ